jgi:DNA-binding HxlR family transcriptional regulator
MIPTLGGSDDVTVLGELAKISKRLDAIERDINEIKRKVVGKKYSF